jgi:hypothetical protein
VQGVSRLRALERIASPDELAAAQDAARAEELDALEVSGQIRGLADEEVRQMFGLPAQPGDERYMTADEVRRLLGMQR